MNKKKEKNVYADSSFKKITAPNKPKNEPKVTRTEGTDLRVRRGK